MFKLVTEKFYGDSMVSKSKDGFETYNECLEDLLKIINTYGVMPQLKYFQSEVFELNEAIFEKEKIGAYPGIEEREHIAEEIADVMVMLKQFQHYYGISDKEIEEIMKYKINRQLERIERGE